jgi:hypothetical protein
MSHEEMVKLYKAAKDLTMNDPGREIIADSLHSEMVLASSEGRSFHPTTVRNVRVMSDLSEDDGHIAQSDDGEILHGDGAGY